MKKYLMIMMGGVIAACGGGASTSSSTTGTGSGQIAITVMGAKSFNPRITPGKITQYEITVSGDGFTPVKTIVSGDATQATVTGIPTGDHRTVHIAAINPNGQAIREGDASDVAIPSDAVAEVPITMQAVPVITNVADGATVSNSRLRFAVFSDPATTIEMTSNTGNTPVTLTDMVENRSEVATDAATGMAAFVPAKLAPGDYTLTVSDTKTGRKSEVTIVVTDGARERAAPLHAIALPGALVMRSE